jgi:predicted transcriptional regulator
MIKEFLFSIRDYAVFKGVTEQTARNRLEEMVENGQAKRLHLPTRRMCTAY